MKCYIRARYRVVVENVFVFKMPPLNENNTHTLHVHRDGRTPKGAYVEKSLKKKKRTCARTGQTGFRETRTKAANVARERVTILLPRGERVEGLLSTGFNFYALSGTAGRLTYGRAVGTNRIYRFSDPFPAKGQRRALQDKTIDPYNGSRVPAVLCKGFLVRSCTQRALVRTGDDCLRYIV